VIERRDPVQDRPLPLLRDPLQRQVDGAVNVEVTFSEALPFFILSIPSVQVRCDVIRYTGGAAPATKAPIPPPKERKRRGLLEGDKP